MRRLLFALSVLVLWSCGYPDYTFSSPDTSPDTTTTSDTITLDTRNDGVTDTNTPTSLGNGQPCTASSECESGVCSGPTGSETCQAPTCSDGVLNGSETDVDCGGVCAVAGSDTGHCAVGKHCAYGADCTLASQSCSPATDAGVLGVCLAPSCTDGKKNGDETDVDCGGSCDSQGFTCANTYACLTNADCKSNLCQTSGAGKICVDAHCTDGTKDEDETDVDCGGASCAPCGNSKMCLQASDCTSGVCSASTTDAGTQLLCQTPTCHDGVQNGTETDVDCGGGACPGCADGLKCIDVETAPKASKDCMDGVCASNICAAPTCIDGIKNGDETGVDCGGTCALSLGYTCGTNVGCKVAGDCVSGVCKSDLCQAATCADGVLNGTETDLDCGGTLCDGQGKTCADGKACAANADCKNSDCQNNKCVSCVDGVKDGAETDVDCGGAACDALLDLCADGKACSVAGDCKSGACSGGKCVSCSDGIKNQNETGIDCGGVCDALGKACSGGSGCSANADCQSLICNGETCSGPSCSDGVQNGSETSIDCGGSCDTVVNTATGFYDLCQITQGCSVPGDCFSKVCTGSLCAAPSCSDTTTNGKETDLNCGVSGTYDGSDTPPTCPLCADGKICINAADCTYAGCHNGLCDHCFSGTKNANETDVDCGGTCATGADKLTCADGKGCAASTDCTSGVCQSSKCVSCSDGIKNQTETDVDCGGICATSFGKTCADRKGCAVNTDCANGNCSGGICVSCVDGVKDGAETDIDCGGATCDALLKTCASGKGCSVNADCAGGTCSGGICNHCADGSKDGNETDVDCGGSDCDALGNLCAVGNACSTNADCASGLCSSATSTCSYKYDVLFYPDSFNNPTNQVDIRIKIRNNTPTALNMATTPLVFRYYYYNAHAPSQVGCGAGPFHMPSGQGFSGSSPSGDCTTGASSGVTNPNANYWIQFYIPIANGGTIPANSTMTDYMEWGDYFGGSNWMYPQQDYSFDWSVMDASGGVTTYTYDPYIVIYQVDSQTAPANYTLVGGVPPT